MACKGNRLFRHYMAALSGAVNTRHYLHQAEDIQ
jgi:hypothetical protein